MCLSDLMFFSFLSFLLLCRMSSAVVRRFFRPALRFQSTSSLEHAIASSVKPGDHCFVHTAMMSPVPLLDELVEQRSRFVGHQSPVKLYHLHTEGRAEYLKYPNEFHSTAFFCAANDRAAVNAGKASFIPVFLSEVSQSRHVQKIQNLIDKHSRFRLFGNLATSIWTLLSCLFPLPIDTECAHWERLLT